MAENKFVKANEEIAEAVVSGYKKIEEGVVGGFTRLTDKLVGQFLAKDDETVEEAKDRLAAEQMAREEAREAEAEKRAAEVEARQYPHKPLKVKKAGVPSLKGQYVLQQMKMNSIRYCDCLRICRLKTLSSLAPDYRIVVYHFSFISLGSPLPVGFPEPFPFCFLR